MKSIESTRLYKEIHQEPEVLRTLIEKPQDAILALAKEIQDRKIKQVFIAARGTSDNAGRYAKYLLGAHNHLVVSLATPSLFTIYEQTPDLSDCLVLGISQSGKSPDIVSVLTEGKKQGALTAALTNYPKSDLANAADIVLTLQAGEELSLAATKTYIAELTSLSILSTELSGSEQYQQDLQNLPDLFEKGFENEAYIDNLAERYRYMTHCVVIGRGFNYASAFEFSLKMKELTYTIAESYSSADFLHGPVALVDQGFPVFIIAPSGKMEKEMQALAEKVQKRQAEVVMFSDHPDLLNIADHKIALPIGVPEWLSPISAILPAQMFAMYLAQTRGFDIDNPRGLNKVTETW
ncbi:MAG: SIS domain-containing protein [Chloroflexota bacterium]|jgi:glucosamine--fructose-6-phosphate aminotransferase (isomerizing)|nr:SIS domain-containing protein [Chloroflexota bacterium]